MNKLLTALLTISLLSAGTALANGDEPNVRKLVDAATDGLNTGFDADGNGKSAAGAVFGTITAPLTSCHLHYKVKGAMIIFVGAGGGDGEITCDNGIQTRETAGGTTTSVNIGYVEYGIGAGWFEEEGDLYAEGVGLNERVFLGLIGLLKARIAFGDGVAIASGLLGYWGPAVELAGSVGKLTNSYGASLSAQAWVIAKE